MRFDLAYYRKGAAILLVALSACMPRSSQAQVITTIVGDANGRPGNTGDGSFSTFARLNAPTSILADKKGNVYIADQNNNKIRKIDIYGVIRTIAGSGAPGSTGDGGPSEKAKLFAPTGLAMDKYGNIYFADSKNNKIRKIDTAGIIYTVAGTGNYDDKGEDTLAIYASFKEPKAVAVDDTGNVYIADCNNNKIRKIDTAGVVHTIAGNGDATYYGDNVPASGAKLNKPSGLAIDPRDGSLVIADTYNNYVRRITPDGIIHNVAGNGVPGFGGDNSVVIAASQVNNPTGVVVDRHGNLFIADQINNRVRKLDTLGRMSTVAGTGRPESGGDGGSALEAMLFLPTAVSVDTLGNLFVAEKKNKIRYVYLDTIPSEFGMDVFPLPCIKHTNIFMPSLYEEIATVFVLNMEGREVARYVAPTNKHVNVYFEYPGTYMIYAVSKHGKWRAKAISLQQ